MRMIRRISIAWVLVALVLACVFVSFFSGPHRSRTVQAEAISMPPPGARVVSTFPGPEDMVGCLHWCGFDRYDRSAVVFYRVRGGHGEILAGQYGDKWSTLIEGEGRGNPLTPDGPFKRIQLAPMIVPRANPVWRWGIIKPYLWLDGMVAPGVHTVEATYDTGEVRRVTTVNNTYSLFADAKALCTIRTYDKQGHVLSYLHRDDQFPLGRGANNSDALCRHG